MRFARIWNDPESPSEPERLCQTQLVFWYPECRNGRIIAAYNSEFVQRETNSLLHVCYGWKNQPIGSDTEIHDLYEALKFLSNNGVVYEIWQSEPYNLAYIVERSICETPKEHLEMHKAEIAQTCPAGGQHKLVGKLFTISINGLHDFQECGKCHAYINPNSTKKLE